ncbi:flagellar biosynthesis protein FlhB [Gemmata sp. JC717]|uniref:flagellar biosynthesis protein FlhB n=1 Tax=Gemmata algarum TaxID=2975278 RepID=UPI0021BB157F|nr:flagellar biosynthesis protein FlhB [Gemmata algarum]MDY3551617.1 flagellar biosynthesis protein FlhB [Gemmata algarum]
MAEDVDQESKTEDPTPRRREEARRQGQVPFSAELVGSLVLVAGVLGLRYLGPDLWATMITVFRTDLPRVGREEFGTAEAAELLGRTALRMLGALLPFFGLLLAVGVGASVAQVGFQLNTEKLEPNLDKLNPVNGVGRLFSLGSVVRGLLTVAKVLALAGVAYYVLNGRGSLVASIGMGRIGEAAPVAWSLVMRLALYLAGAVALVAVFDYVYQRYKFEQSLMMTKEELKQELKQEEGDPHVKARVRQIARERTKRKMLSEVPKATVVVTNPTHYAVALRYDSARDSAPVVVAKGKGAFALRIAKRARESGVPVLERPPLARALQSVREGQQIPGVLFRAVAEVLAFVMKMRGGTL